MGCQDAPDYGKAASEAAEADIRTLPARKKLDRLAKLGEKGFVEFKDRKGRSVVEMVDFTGIGDIDLSRANLDFFIESAGTVSEAMLAQAEQYGVKFVEQRRKELQAADPEGFEMRQEMGKRIMEGGEKHFAAAAKGAMQGVRGSQSARGNLFGNAPSIQEAMAVGDVGYRMYQQDLANMGAFGAGVAPTAQFGALSGAQQGASPFAGQNIMQTGVGAQTNQQFGQATGNIYQQQAAMAQQGSPWMQLGGMAAGLGLTALTGGAAGMAGGIGFGSGVSNIFGVTTPPSPPACWVAREVFGVTNPMWMLFYDWKENDGPKWLKLLYNKFGESAARFIRNKPVLKRLIKRAMTKVIIKKHG
tara:strand:+ start:1217 stop:2293 length:1077 start_codon:yes stop_codon:yes gene_type:complete